MAGIDQFPVGEERGAQRNAFSPYELNGGTIVAIAGDDYAVIACDTRLSSGFGIHSRSLDKLFKLSSNTVLASTGCLCDTVAFTDLVRLRMQMYEMEHNKIMSTEATASMLSNLMYNKRLFPYYLSNVLAGLDKEGNGVVYSYDPIGHCERKTYAAGGSSGPLLQPVLDNLIAFKNMHLEYGVVPNLHKERALCIVNDTFTSAAERDVYTGDSVFMNIITNDGIEEQRMSLRKD